MVQKLCFCGRVPWLYQYLPGGFMLFVVLCPGTSEGSTGSGSGFKASQKTGQNSVFDQIVDFPIYIKVYKITYLPASDEFYRCKQFLTRIRPNKMSILICFQTDLHSGDISNIKKNDIEDLT